MLHPRAIGRSPLWKDDGHRERDGDRVRMKGASAPSAARAAARRVGTREVIRGAMPQASASTPRRVKREVNAAGIRFYAKEGEAGGHPRRNAAGIRFYAKEGEAGGHPRRNAAGIRFYAKEGEAGNHPRRNAAGIRFYAKGGGAGNHPR